MTAARLYSLCVKRIFTAMKTGLYLESFAILVVIFISVQDVHSQGIPPHLQADYNRMMRTRNTTFNHNNLMWGRPVIRFNNEKYFANLRYDFTVILKDSSARLVNSKIHIDTVSNKTYLLQVNKKLSKDDPNREERLYCDQTIRIFRIDPTDYMKIEGFANDSCWLFKVVSGKINAYSSLPEVTKLTAGYLSAFQVDDGAVKPITRESLLEVIIDNTKATICFYDGDYLAAIRRFNQDFEKSSKKQKG